MSSPPPQTGRAPLVSKSVLGNSKGISPQNYSYERGLGSKTTCESLFPPKM